MYYGWRGMTLEADEYLAKQGLSRPHHRILYVVARRPDIAIGALIEILGISKQALNRPLNLLLERKLLTSKRAPEQHRSKLLRLTEAGRRIEQRHRITSARSCARRSIAPGRRGRRHGWPSWGRSPTTTDEFLKST